MNVLTYDPKSQDLLLRRHFFEFTRAFLSVFEDYTNINGKSASGLAVVSNEPYTGTFVAPPSFQLPLHLNCGGDRDHHQASAEEI